MKKNGFTLVELLASLVILGLLMVLTVPNVVGILSESREKTYNEDAKKLISTAKYKMSGNNGVVRPGSGQCIVMSLGYLDNSEYDNPPNGGEYLIDQSFVVVKRNGKRYEYFVRLSEQLTNGKLFGIDVISESNLEKGAKAVNLSNINNVNVAIDSIDKNYIKSKCSCSSVLVSYFRNKH